MGIKRIVDTDFWTDDKVMGMFTPEDKLFMLYLMTNPHTTQLGIYKVLPKQIAFELGYSQETVLCLIDRFETKYKMIQYSIETSEIAVKNYLCYSIVKGGQPVLDLLHKEAKKVKNKDLLSCVIENVVGRTDNKTVLTFINDIKKENDNDNDNDNDNEDSYPESYDDSCDDSSTVQEVYSNNSFVAFLPLNTGDEYGITQNDIDLWQSAYEALDILSEIKKMRVWLDANPKNRKTKSGMKRFIVNWLNRSQNSAPRVQYNGTERGTRNERFESNGSSNGVTYGRTI